MNFEQFRMSVRLADLKKKARNKQQKRDGALIEPLEVRALLSSVPTSTALAESVAASVSGQSITLTATVTGKSGKPTGSVTFKNGSTSLGSAALNTSDKATLIVKSLPVGTDSLTAVYTGTTAFAASTSPVVKQVVSAASTKTTITTSASSVVLGLPASLTVTVTDLAPGSGTPAGTVKLYDGKTLLGTQTLNSKGQFTGSLPTLFVGAHSLSAVYAGTAQAKTSASAATTFTVKLPTMTKAANGLQVGTVSAGIGAGAVAGESLHVNYIGFLQNGTIFDSSVKAGASPFDFTLGVGQVIAGWDQGMVGLKVGEQRVLIIPPALGYGANAAGSIPPNSMLTFLVQLLSYNGSKLVITGTGSANVGYNQAPTTTNGTLFASVKSGQTGPIETFTISNAGVSVLQFASASPITVSGGNASDFVITQPVIANGKATFTIRFKPSATGVRKTTLSILTNDPMYPTFSFTIQGTGT